MEDEPPRKKIYLRPGVKGKRSDDVLHFYEALGNKYVCLVCRERWEWRKANDLLLKGKLLCAVDGVPLVVKDPPRTLVPLYPKASSDTLRCHLVREHGGGWRLANPQTSAV